MKRDMMYQIAEPPRIVIRKGAGAVLIHHDEIRWMEARGHHTDIHTADTTFTVRQSIGQVEKVLEGTAFIRIQRSIIVNAMFIRETKSWLRGEVKIILYDGTELLCSRSYKDKLDRAIGPSAVPAHQDA